MPQQLFMVMRQRGAGWQDDRGIETQKDWAAHAAFMDGLASEGVVQLAGPIPGTRDVLLVVRGDSREQIEARLAGDPWTVNGLLRTTRVDPWTLRLGSLTSNPFNHLDLRVTDMKAAAPFYAALLPELGLIHAREAGEWRVHAGQGRHPWLPYVGLVEDAAHHPNATRVAFQVSGAAEVDRLAEVVRKAGGRNVSGPKPCPEYSPTYYAIFFEDPCGNRLEICHRTS
jgi:predicted enzyme related to lactoylglutathione lyase/uncharacterized protein YciI